MVWYGVGMVIRVVPGSNPLRLVELLLLGTDFLTS